MVYKLVSLFEVVSYVNK